MTVQRCVNDEIEFLTQLVEQRLPVHFTVSGDRDAGQFVATAILSRAATSLKAASLLVAEGFVADSGIVIRSLYEHAVHFAWIMVDPSETRMEQWREEDLRLRIAADEDAGSLGQPLLSDEKRADFEHQKSLIRNRTKRLQEMAKEADDYWVSKLEGLESGSGFSSFWGLYVVLYRNLSSVAHPSQRGLHPVTLGELPDPNLTVDLERRIGTGRDLLGIASVLFALMLLVASDRLGWPERARVLEAFSDATAT